MKILFLDIDGVLNSTTDWIEWERFGHPINHGTDMINRGHLALLDMIIEHTDCLIVVSSTWRVLFTNEELVYEFYKRGWENCSIDYFLGQTPAMMNAIRGDEIKHWLDNNQYAQVTHYCIVDDNADMLDEQMPYFVQTDEDVGLTLERARQIVKILDGNTDQFI